MEWEDATRKPQTRLPRVSLHVEIDEIENALLTYGYGQKHKAWITHPNPHAIHTSIHRVWIKRWVCDPSPWITQLLVLPLPQQSLLLLLPLPLLLLPPPLLLLLLLLPPLPLLLPLRLLPLLLLLLPLLRLLPNITSITTATTDLAEATRFNFRLTSHSGKRF